MRSVSSAVLTVGGILSGLMKRTGHVDGSRSRGEGTKCSGDEADRAERIMNPGDLGLGMRAAAKDRHEDTTRNQLVLLSVGPGRAGC